jgi:hypothetical protein
MAAPPLTVVDNSDIPVLATWKFRSKSSKSGVQFPKQFQVYHRGNGKIFERMLQVASTPGLRLLTTGMPYDPMSYAG